MTVRLTPWHRASPARRLLVAALGVGSVWRGIAYTIPPGPHTPSQQGGAVEVLTLGHPTWTLGVLWISVGILAIGSAIAGRWVIATAAIGAAWLTWGLAYTVAWATPAWGQPTDWISTGTYLPTAVAILALLLIRETPTVEED